MTLGLSPRPLPKLGRFDFRNELLYATDCSPSASAREKRLEYGSQGPRIFDRRWQSCGADAPREIVIEIRKFCDLHGFWCIKQLVMVVAFALSLGEGRIFG